MDCIFLKEMIVSLNFIEKFVADFKLRNSDFYTTKIFVTCTYITYFQTDIQRFFKEYALREDNFDVQIYEFSEGR